MMLRKILLFACLVGLLTGCHPRRTTVVLVPDPDGYVGEIEIQTQGGQQILSESGQAVIVKNEKDPPSPPTVFDEQQIHAIFGKALEAEPPVPKKFILYFKTNSTELRPDAKALLPDIIACIHQRNSFDISVNGHSDRAGSDEYNLSLSLKRAEYIRDLLIKEGIEAKYITTTSHGEGNPLIPTADGVAEPRNRRVEVIVR
jgi:outer membrane protein OmpA-like peptidoglycan-associated protein